jgi:hypothetical protein
MRALRPALLVLLTSALAGLGVPEGSGQSTGASTGKKKSATSAAASKSHHSSGSSSTKAGAGAATKSPGESSGQTASGKTAASKTASSKTAGKKTGKSPGRSRKQTGQKAPTSDRISEIQAALAKEGSYQGLPSGKWDDDTSAAMRKFQKSHGLNPNGKLDAPSLQRLGLGSQTAGVAAPTPPPGATSRLTSSNSIPSGNADAARQQ